MVVDYDTCTQPECDNEKNGTGGIVEQKANEGNTIFFHQVTGTDSGALTRSDNTSDEEPPFA